LSTEPSLLKTCFEVNIILLLKGIALTPTVFKNLILPIGLSVRIW